MITNLNEDEISKLMSINWKVIYEIDCPVDFLIKLLKEEKYADDIDFYYLVTVRLWKKIGKKCFKYTTEESIPKISKLSPVELALNTIYLRHTLSINILIDALKFEEESESEKEQIFVSERLLSTLHITIDELIEKIGIENIKDLSREIAGGFNPNQLRYNLELFSNMSYSKFKLYMNAIFRNETTTYKRKIINQILDGYNPEKTESFKKYKAELKISNKW